MLKVSALFLCVISCLVFHCDDSQGDSAMERQTSPSHYSKDNTQLAEQASESTVADEQTSPDHKDDIDKVTASVVKTQQDIGPADDTVRHNVQGERSLGSNDVTSDPYSTHRSSFPPESTQKAANHDEANASSLPPGGAIGKPTANQDRVEGSDAQETTAQRNMDDSSQVASTEDVRSQPSTATDLDTTTTPPTTTTTHTADSQIDRPPTSTDQPHADTPDQPPVATHDSPPQDTAEKLQPPDDTAVDSANQPPADADDKPPQDIADAPPKDTPPADAEPVSESEKEGKQAEVGKDGEGREVQKGAKGDMEEVEGKREPDVGAGKGETREEEARKPDPGVRKVEDMPSFEEWKRQMLDKQQAEIESKQHMEAQIATPGGTAQNKPKSRVNYARASCGAKVIAANPEATNPGFILTENRDQYMINPCNVKKWFVVELCEPIQIENLELGNLELFSSQPESFVVSSSGRFPTKEWKELGTLHAREERAVQSFPVLDQLFTKYLRLEMKSHYGNEHYCPLTVLRVFGTTVLDDDNDEFAYSPDGHTTEDSVPPSKEDKPSNLFTTAADTVLSLVKTVLSPSEEKQNATDDHQLDDVVKLDVATKNASKIAAKGQLNNTTPCAHHPRMSPAGLYSYASSAAVFYACDCCRSRAAENVCYFDMCSYFNVSNFTWPVCCAEKIHRLRDRTNNTQPDSLGSLPSDKNVSQDISTGVIDTATKSIAKESVPVDIEQEKDTNSDKTISEETPAATPSDNVVTQQVDTISKSTSDVSDKTLSSSEVTHVRTALTTRAVVTATVNIELSVSPSMSSTGTKDADVIEAPNVSNDVTSVTLESSMDVVAHGSLAVTPTMTLGNAVMTQTATKSSSHEHTSAVLVGSAVTTQDVQATPTLSSSVTKPTSTPQTPQTPQTPTHNDDTTHGHVTSDSQDKSVPQDSAEPTTNYTAKTSVMPINPTIFSSKVIRRKVKPINTGKDKATTDFNQTAKTSQAETANNVTGKAKKDIYAELPSDSATGRDPPPLLPPTEAGGEEVPVNRLAKKEMTYMRLKNRIKTLEMNLNLSSSYLEQLSQRYKLYMDNMYHYLNQTINKLANTTESAEARDLKQQEDIARLQKQVDTLSATVTALVATNDQLHKQVIERHLFLMLMEAVVFVCVIIWFMTRQHFSARADVRTVTEPVAPPTKNTPSHAKHRRYKSVDLTPSRQKTRLAPSSQDDLQLHKPECESALTIISHDIPLFITTNSATKSSQEQTWPRPGHKKKKKKGAGCQKQLWHKDSSSQSLSRGQDSESDSMSVHSSSSCTSSNQTPPNACIPSVRTVSSNTVTSKDSRRPPKYIANIGASQSCIETVDGVSDRFSSLLSSLKTKWYPHVTPTERNNIYSTIVRDTRLTSSKSLPLYKENGHI